MKAYGKIALFLETVEDDETANEVRCCIGQASNKVRIIFKFLNLRLHRFSSRIFQHKSVSFSRCNCKFFPAHASKYI